MQNKIDLNLKKKMESAPDQKNFSVLIFFSPCSERDLKIRLEERFHIEVEDSDNDQKREKFLEGLTEKLVKRNGKEISEARIVDILKMASTSNQDEISFVREKIPHSEILSDKLILNCAKKGKTMTELMLLAYDQYASFCRRECIKDFIAQKKADLKKLSLDGSFSIEREYENLSWVIATASPAAIMKVEKLDFIKCISLHQNDRCYPTLDLNNSNQKKMGIDISKKEGYDGTGINIGIVEAIITRDVPFKEGIDTNYRHLEGADIDWKYTNPEGDFAKSNHANQVASVIVGQKKSTKVLLVSKHEYEGVVPGATVYGTSCSDAETLYDGLDYVIGKNVSIINLSLGFNSLSYKEYGSVDAAVDEVAELHQVTIVIAAGNSELSEAGVKICSPAHAYNAIVVGNIDTTGKEPYKMNPDSRYDQSACPNESNKPDICASGTDITFSISSSSTEEASGTSLSAPYVTGVIAQMMEANSGLKTGYVKVKAILIASANDDIVDGTSNMLISDSDVLRKKSGGGIIDAGVAVELAKKGGQTGIVLNLEEKQTLGQIFKVLSSNLTLAPNQKIKMVLCFNKPESGVLNFDSVNNIDLAMYQSESEVLVTNSKRNNVEVLKYSNYSNLSKTFNLRAFLRSYIPSSSTAYLRVIVAYRVYE